MRPLARSSLTYEAEALAAALPPLLVEARRVAATVSAGLHGRRRTGPGETFWQFRRHQPGDPASAVDWRRSARSDRLYVRETEWAAAQAVWLWCDRSPSMAFRSDPGLPEKGERAALLILAAAALLVRGGERVALLEEGGEGPGGGQAALERLALGLEGSGGDDGLPPSSGLPRHARLVLAGDFLAPLDLVAERLDGLGRTGPAGHLVQVLDPAEETLPYAGRILFEGPEGEGDWLAGRAEDLRGPYRAALARHRDGLAALARDKGWTFAVHRTDHAPETALLALYQTLERSC